MGLARDLETICLKCLEREPRKRYPTAQAVADELRRWLAGEPIQARAITRAARAWRWCKRRPTVAGLLATVGACLVVIAGVSSYYWRVTAKSEHEARRQLYIQTMNSAGEAFFQNNFARARRLHDQFKDSDLRQFEWWWLQKAMTPASLVDEIDVPYGVGSLCFSPLGDRVAFGLRNGNVFVFDWERKRRQAYGLSDTSWAVNPVMFLDEHHVVCGKANRILRIDLRTRDETPVGDHPSDIVRLAASGNVILSGCLSGRVRLWRIGTPKPIRDLQVSPGWNAVAISPDGVYLAAGDGDGVIWVWRSDGPDEPLAKISGHGSVSTLSFSPSAELLASGGNDRTMKVWRWQQNEEVFQVGLRRSAVVGDVFRFR